MDSIVEQMHTFFEPKAVAVIGASRRTMKAGHVIFKNFVINKQRNLFKAKLYPVRSKGYAGNRKKGSESGCNNQLWI